MKNGRLLFSLLAAAVLACTIPLQALAQPGGGSANVELTAKRDTSQGPSTGVAGKWIAKEGDNDVKLDIKVDGSKLSGTIENTQFPGPIAFKDGKLEGNTIAFSYMRLVGGQEMPISWTGTLSGDELKLKRSVGGGMPGGPR
jgi:hypothetical protein